MEWSNTAKIIYLDATAIVPSVEDVAIIVVVAYSPSGEVPVERRSSEKYL